VYITTNEQNVKSKVDFDAIPAELKTERIWTLWVYEERADKDGNLKPTKVPVQPVSAGEYYRLKYGRDWRCSRSNDPKTWWDYETVRQYYDVFPDRFEGVGIFLTDGVLGGDLDKCRDPETGAVDERARDVVDLLATYTEVSPSGTGVRLLMRATFEDLAAHLGVEKPRDLRYRQGRVEFYDKSSPRFVTLTGHRLQGCPTSLQACQDRFTEVYQELFGAAIEDARTRKGKRERARDAYRATNPSPVDVEDSRLLEVAFRARNGDQVRNLWEGRWEDRYPSQSEADLALCSHLAFYAGPDPDRVDRLFQASGLVRPKWDRPDYKWRVLDRVCERDDYYKWDPGDTTEERLEAIVGVHNAAGAVLGDPTVEPSFDDYRLPSEPTAAPKDDLLSLLELKQLAESINRVWIADRWLQAGHLAVLSGREKRGKSTAVYDLITAAISGQAWMGAVACERSPVLLLDYENPADYVWANLSRMLDAREVDYASADRWYGQVDPDLIRKNASPLVVEYAVDRIRRLQDRTGQGSGLLVIDTAAPAWMAQFADPGWTNSNTQVRTALEIGQTIARQTRWTSLVIYHDNKSGTGAAGSYEWYGTPDVFLRFEREINAPLGHLSILGRLADPPLPLEFRREPSGLLQAAPKGAAEATIAADEDNTRYTEFLMVLHSLTGSPEKALSQKALCDHLKDRFGRNQVVRDLKRGVLNGPAIHMAEGPHNAKLYWC
jgi:primase-polymerase (primpol)-like protein